MTTRTPKHARNPQLEAALRELNCLCESVELAETARFLVPRRPILFIVGGARSGSTVAMQLLAASGQFGYVSNFMSRFPSAPYMFARVQQIYTEFDVLGEFPEFRSAVPFRSELGKTQGFLAPHEFWYFWRRHFEFPDPMSECSDAVRVVAAEHLGQELAALEEIFDKPLLFKGSIFSWNIPLLARVVPTAFFLHVHRDPVRQGASLLRARQEFFGDEDQWYSWRTPDFDWLRTLSVHEQVVGQAMSVDASVRRGFSQVAAERCLCGSYESLCESPDLWLERIGGWLARQGEACQWVGLGADLVVRAASSSVAGPDLALLEAARERLSENYEHRGR